MRVKGWSGRSGLSKVDLYTRGTVYVLIWGEIIPILVFLLLPPIRDPLPPLAWAGAALGVVQAVLCARLARRAMDAYLGQGEVPRRLLCSATAVTAGVTAVVLVLLALGNPKDYLPVSPILLGAVLTPLTTVHCLLVRNRVTAAVQAGLLLGICLFLLLIGHTPGQALGSIVVVFFLTSWLAFTARASMWILAVMWELHAARDVQARLAVAEERLRFSRDLHDVMGRNLAAIALKSELAVQLSRRGRPEAAGQMTEVQQIARDSQREVRDVVRGYREADLRVELDGARGVLTAAGITCTVVVGELEVPQAVQSALGWVVREATTNVLRHGDARRCTISVGCVDGEVVLTVENDGTGRVGKTETGPGPSGPGPGGPGPGGPGPGGPGPGGPGPGGPGPGGDAEPVAVAVDAAGQVPLDVRTGPEPGRVPERVAAVAEGRVPLVTPRAEPGPEPVAEWLVPGSRAVREPAVGTGLAGLRERLSAVHGTLEAGPGRAGHFRLTARVPVPGGPAENRPS
ncbi:histidine kinase [Streptomyces sp. CAU 1734]|uniref:sensor histidine kinase n=1 Tax=Streptomyces sp. CAU 1734 TaxID=3140360 RepID=UPI00326095A0